MEWLQTLILLNGAKGMQEPCQYSLTSVMMLLKLDLARPSLDFIASSPLVAIANHEAFRGATWRLSDLMR